MDAQARFFIGNILYLRVLKFNPDKAWWVGRGWGLKRGLGSRAMLFIFIIPLLKYC